MTTLELTVDGTGYGLADPEVSYDYGTDELTFTPSGPPCWADGDSIAFSLDALVDSTGGFLSSPVRGWVVIDLTPPTFSGATPTGMITTEDAAISIDAADDICGTAVYDSIVVTISGGTPTTYTGLLEADITGLVDGDVVEICAYASDDCADYCDQHSSSYCWDFSVAMGDPGATVMYPVDVNTDGMVVSTCECQPIAWQLAHAYTLIEGTIEVEVEGIIYTTADPELTLSADTDSLIFTPIGPAPCWTHGDTVNFSLLALTDSTGGTLGTPVTGWFIPDFEGPIFSGESPTGTITSPSTEVTVTATDELCIDAVYDSINVTGPGTDETVTGDLTVDLSGLSEGMYNVTAWAHDDCADYCEPNYTDFSWSFDVLLPCDLTIEAYPEDTLVCRGTEVALSVTADSRYPITSYEWQPSTLFDDNTVANPTTLPVDENTMFTVLVTDSNMCTLMDTVNIEISPDIVIDIIPDQILCPGITYSPGLSGDASITGGTEPLEISWESSLGDVIDGEVNPTLNTTDTVDHTWTVYVTDAIGCTAEATFNVTIENVELGNFAMIAPLDGDTVDAGDLTMEWSEAENADFYAFYLDGVQIADSMIPPLSIDSSFLCEESHDIEIIAFRSCYYELLDDGGSVLQSGFSDAETTWVNATFHTVTCGAPTAEILVPGEGIYSACPDQHVLLTIEDISGYDIDPATIDLEIEGVIYDIDHDFLYWDAPYLTWIPAAGVLEEGAVTATLTDAANVMGVHISEPVTVNFWIDLTPPVAEFTSPGQGAIVMETTPELSFEIDDNLSGVDPSFLLLTVNGEAFPSAELDFTDPWLNFPTDGMDFIPGDSVIVQLTACDSPTPPESLYCSPNCDLFRWSFYIAPEFECDAVPIPFTPGEASNNYVQFEFPGLGLEEGTIKIFNVRNVPVREITANTREEARWFGRDDGGTDQKQGLYLYIIEVDGEIVCNGSIVLAR